MIVEFRAPVNLATFLCFLIIFSMLYTNPMAVTPKVVYDMHSRI